MKDVDADSGPELVRTARLVLRRVQLADVDAMVELHADPAAVRYRPEGASSREDSTLLFYSWLAHWEEFGFGYWAIELPGYAEPIGFGGLQLAQSEQGSYLNVFYRLFPHAWGRGFAPEMVGAAVEWARLTYPDLPITIITPAVNEPARRVAEKLGFTEVGRDQFQGALSCFFELLDP